MPNFTTKNGIWRRSFRNGGLFLIICLICSIFSIYTLHIWYFSNTRENFLRQTLRDPDNSVLISYVAFAPEGSKEPAHLVCQENMDIFAERAVASTNSVDYVFSLIGSTRPSNALKTAKNKNANVQIYKNALNKMYDVLTHLSVLKNVEKKYDYFILLNCGARGPYFYSEVQALDNTISSLSRTAIHQKLRWIEMFTNRLIGDVGLLGPTISEEISHHVQSYTLAFPTDVKDIVIDHLDNFETLFPDHGNGTVNYGTNNRAKHVAYIEVGLSTRILKEGYNIATLDPRLYMEDFRVRKKKDACKYSQTRGCPEHNPTNCVVRDGERSFGCDGLEPCAVVFVKYGGEILTTAGISTVTTSRIKAEDEKSERDRCMLHIKPIKPKWDPKTTLSKIGKPLSIRFDPKGGLVIIIRTHAAYLSELVRLLYSLESSAMNHFKNIQVLVLPTEQKDIKPIVADVANVWDQKLHSISVEVIQIPEWIYDECATYLPHLCTKKWKANIVSHGIYAKSDISRFCDVNSPLHYMLVDLVLEYLKEQVETKQRVNLNHQVESEPKKTNWLLITNADNIYLPEWFSQLSRLSQDTHPQPYHVYMTNMIHQGEAFKTEPRRHHIDLGAYALNMTFMKEENVSFMGSLPYRTDASDYHDLDGIFIEYLKDRKHANIWKDEAYSFFHN